MVAASPRVSALKPGDVVEGRYRILSTLGEGGMGTVFLAEHALIKRRVAIKLLHAELATDDTVIERFMNEARAAGTLGHPNIVESTDMGFTHDHVPYIVFEYLEGSLLTDEIYRVGGLPVRRAVRIAQQMASALHAAHNAAIVHRDLKSDNVFLTDKDDALDHVKVLDFGISRFLHTEDAAVGRGTVMGTPEYMAPEQITDPDHIDKRADIYALGVILYEMLTARRPFTAEADPRALMERIVTELPPPLMRPEVPLALVELIMTKLLAKSPAERYQSMVDVEAALDAFTTHGDAPRRRSRPIAAVSGDDVARHSTTIPRPALGANTPYPGMRLDTMMDQVSLPVSRAKKPWLVYGLAAAGVFVGAAGLLVGMRGDTQVAQRPSAAQPAPAASTDQAPARAEPAAKITVELAANVPHARVTFRRRVLAAPTSMQLMTSDIVELVEVSAPGKKTVRYWLTFDRATKLQANLVDGTGSIEATEEETLVALGEIAAPTQLAAAPPPAKPEPVVTAKKDVEKDVAKAMPAVAKAAASETTRAVTMRKVGRGPTEVVAAVAAVAPVAPVAAGSAAVAPAAIVEIDQAPAADELPTASQVAAEPEAKAKVPEAQVAAPTAELAVAKAVPAIERAAVPATAPAVAKFDERQIASLFASHRPDVAKCVADIRGGGTLTLMLQVDASGKVKRVQVQSTIKNPLASACVMKSANSWRFPARPGADTIEVRNSFVIK